MWALWTQIDFNEEVRKESEEVDEAERIAKDAEKKPLWEQLAGKRDEKQAKFDAVRASMFGTPRADSLKRVLPQIYSDETCSLIHLDCSYVHGMLSRDAAAALSLRARARVALPLHLRKDGVQNPSAF